jgi:heme-degrading monooxygenase HmoA
MRMIEARLRGEQAQGLAGADTSHQAGRDEQPDPKLELAMYARVMTSSPKPGTAETAIAEWPQHIGAFKGKGLVAGYLFFDRTANQFLSITIWESEEAQKRNATSAEQIHGRAEFMKHLTGAPVPSTYEVAAVVK